MNFEITLNYNEKDKEYYAKNNRLAYYTCYFGGDYNYSKLVPPIPSNNYDCFFFTNNIGIYNELQNTKWKLVFLDKIPIHNCFIKDTMETKEIRSCPHRFNVLNDYDYLCWFDTKLEVYENKTEELILDLENNENKIIVLSKHPYSDKQNSVWDEFSISMPIEKYNLQKEQYTKYINKQIKDGFSEKINIRFCGGWSLRKKCKKTEEYNESWYSHIKECGIQDQISLQFVQQIYIDNIIPVEYQYTWKYFYE